MNKINPTISIVTPSYNQAPYLEKTLRSVLGQGYDGLEYIVMDGGSTDGSVEIIQRYAAWLTHWVSQPDGGQSQAINRGFSLTHGQIMGWLNSDDYLADGALQRVAALLGGKRMSMLVGSSIQLGEDGAEMLDARKPGWIQMVYDCRTFPQPSVFWTRDLWEAAGGLDERLYFVMDYDLWLRMRCIAAQVVYCDEVLSYAQNHQLQKSRQAEGEGDFQRFTAERAFVSIRAANQRKESIVLWLVRLWLYRFYHAVMLRKPWQMKGSAFHHEVTRQVLGKAYAPSSGVK